MGTFIQDLRYGVRMLGKRRAFTVIAILTLALGIGANTAIFTVVNAVLLRPLPYVEPERLVELGSCTDQIKIYSATPNRFRFWRDHSQSFEAMATSRGAGSVNLAVGDEPEYVTGLKVSADFFRVLGVGPALGRSFTAEEDRPGGERLVILSDGLWRRRFNAERNLVGQSVTVEYVNYTVIGIMPPEFQFSPQPDLLFPLRLGSGELGESGSNYPVVARLKPGVTRAAALEEMKLIAEAYRAQFPKQMSETESITVLRYGETDVADIRPALLVLLTAVAFVLLIACANVANLQLARSASRQKEMAIRLALGAGSLRIVRQLLTEGLLLALIGGGGGLLLAVWGVDSLKAFIPNNLLPDRADIRFDGRVLLFTLVTAVVTGVLFGLAPAIQAARVDVNTFLKESAGKGVAAGKGRLRSALVVVEIAMSMVLLVGAALTIRTFANLRGVEPGFDPQKVLTFSMMLSGPKYDTTAKLSEATARARARLQSMPGVEAVAVSSKLPLHHWLNLPVEFAGQPDLIKAVEWQAVSPDYFRVMKIALKQGRDFADTDTESAAGVAIVNEAFVARFYPDLDPLGQHITVARVMKPEYAGPAPLAIIGVVRDVKQFSLQSAAPPMVMVPTAQVPTALMRALKLDTNFILRTTGNPLALGNAVKQAMREVDANQPILRVRSMEQVLWLSIAPQQFNMLLLGLFAATGLILAGIGIYGVISYSITQRTHEIGIRMALGARARDVLRLVMGQGLILGLVGVGLGIAGALALTRLMSSMLYGVSTTDPLTFALTALALLGVALAACFVPARRATKVDPMIALRYE